MTVYVVIEMWQGLIDPAPSVYTDKRDAQTSITLRLSRMTIIGKSLGLKSKSQNHAWLK